MNPTPLTYLDGETLISTVLPPIRFVVRLNITLLLILVKSFGTVTYAISNLLSGKPYVAFDFISPYVPTRGMLPCKQFNTR